ncbi:6,7-dimethyl-8-ribityllumazine synthase [Polaromonas sp.]|nr:6,7-dimethyl-8-ribityllumazine synthase [Polaromonas sp.]
MLDAKKGLGSKLDGAALSIGIVQARFNEDITNALASACKEELARLGVPVHKISHVVVPGALEVGCALQALLQTERFDALIALGCIIRGETYHFELVANESAAAVTRLALDYRVPIANAILTVENLAQAQARQLEKGRDAALVAVEMANLLKALPHQEH